ncbi:MAG: hypothetical protein U0Q10_14990 [Dermatophilaceae bacterium]
MADTVGVRSRSAKTPDAPTILWIGRVDGTFTIGESETPLDQPGTEVRIQPRHGDLEWCNESTTRKLTSDFAEILDVPVRIKGDLLSLNTPPWERTIEEQLTWCRERARLRGDGHRSPRLLLAHCQAAWASSCPTPRLLGSARATGSTPTACSSPTTSIS